MNQYAPADWSATMGDAFAPLGGGGGDDDGLIELLWCNGHVVMQTQAAPRKPPPTTRPDHKAAAGVAPQQDDEAAAWFQYPAVEDPLERDLFAELFGETAREGDDEGETKAAVARQARLMPPPRRPAKARARGSGDASAAAAATEGGDSSMLTVGSSFCGSNHVQPPAPACALPHQTPTTAPRAGGSGSRKAAAARDAATVSSSSMRPRSCATRSGQPGPGKRKQSDAAEEAEDAEFESAADVTREPPQKLTTAKRRRAAEVHNLSERRRRDRINEKMKALQELIPHCNKTDKASMLDEAIEYLKSLQLQLQMMWMGGGMAAVAAAPVVFQAAGVHHQYMQPMVAAPPPHHAHVASMPRMPFMAPPPAVQTTAPVPDPYARYLAVDHLQPPPPMHYLQGMGAFYPPQIPALLPPPPAAVPGGGSLPAAATARTSPSDGILHKKYESCGKSDLQGMTS